MGRLTIRIPEELLAQVKSAASENGWTINTEVIFRLRQNDSRMTAIRQQNDSNLTADSKVTAKRQQSDSRVTAPEPVKEVSDEEVSLSWRERAAAIDCLPNGGDKLRPASDFQQRRRKQIELLQESWLALGIHTSPLVREGALRFLQVSEDWCEVVINAFEWCNAAGKSGPGMQGYILKMLPDYLTRHKEELNKRLGGKHYPTTEELEELEWAKQAAIDAGLFEPGDEEWSA